MSSRSTRSSSKSPSPLGTPGSTPTTSKLQPKRKRPRDSKSKFSPVQEEITSSLISEGISSELFTPDKDHFPGASPPSARRRTDDHHVEQSSPLPHISTSPKSALLGIGEFSSPLAYPHPQTGLVRAIKDMEISSPLSYFSEGLGLTPRRSGIGGTPLRPRGDIQSESRMRTVTIGDTSSQADVRSETAQIHSVIWGTDVNIQETKDSFKSFINSFQTVNNEMIRIDGDNGPYYLQKLEEIQVLEDPFLNINCDHLSAHNHNLYLQLVRYPQEVIPAFDLSANELFFHLYPDSELEHQIQVRPYNVDKTRNMRLLNPEDIDQLITVSGMIIRTSTIIPEMRQAYFECHICQKGMTGLVERGRVTEPSVCPGCQTLHSMQLIHNRSIFSDKQMLKLQESPDDMPPGQTPHTIALYAHNDLVDTVQPGDKLAVTGIYRAAPLRVNPRTRNLRSVYKTYVDVIHFRRSDTKRLHGMDTEENMAPSSDPNSVRHGPVLTAERVAELKHLSQSPDIYERLSRALAPSIFENQDIKKGILLQLFGGTKKDDLFKEAGRGQFRADINILLCGDPGTSKSQLLQYVHRLMPRSQYTSGKGSSAVGLTAYVTKDPETRQLVLQTGALALSDNGVCCIDEFDKMTDSTRSILHEVMEQQTLSIAKAGIICSINARTSILAAANPRMSTWDSRLTTVENIQLPHTLISRFDLIFLMLDPQDELFDRRLAQHLVSLYNISDTDSFETEDVDMHILRDYIAYARAYIQPKLIEEAGQSLIQAYVDMRKVGSSRGAVTAYPRQLESLIRLSESHARMRFTQTVELHDVEEAKRLHREALKQSAMDPKTGIIDISILTTGISASERSRKADLAREVFKLLQKMEGKTQTISKILTHFQDKTQKQITEKQLDDALKLLRDEEKIMILGKQIRIS